MFCWYILFILVNLFGNCYLHWVQHLDMLWHHRSYIYILHTLVLATSAVSWHQNYYYKYVNISEICQAGERERERERERVNLAQPHTQIWYNNKCLQRYSKIYLGWQNKSIFRCLQFWTHHRYTSFTTLKYVAISVTSLWWCHWEPCSTIVHEQLKTHIAPTRVVSRTEITKLISWLIHG